MSRSRRATAAITVLAAASMVGVPAWAAQTLPTESEPIGNGGRVSLEPEPEPEPTPGTGEESDPAPTTQEPSTEPTTVSPDPEPTTEDPVPDPVTPEPAPDPTDEATPPDPEPDEDLGDELTWDEVEEIEEERTGNNPEDPDTEPSATEEPSEPSGDETGDGEPTGNPDDERSDDAPVDPVNPEDPTDSDETTDSGDDDGSDDKKQPGDPVTDDTDGEPVDPEPSDPFEPDPTTDDESTGAGIDDPTKERRNQAPTFSAIPSLTAPTRSAISTSDLYASVVVHDDRDKNLRPTISSWGGWLEAGECPGGYPCEYVLTYEVVDSSGAAGHATRTITITGPTGQQSSAGASWGSVVPSDVARPDSIVDRGDEPAEAPSASGEEGQEGEPAKDLAHTGASTSLLGSLAGMIFAGGAGLLALSRRTERK